MFDWKDMYRYFAEHKAFPLKMCVLVFSVPNQLLFTSIAMCKLKCFRFQIFVEKHWFGSGGKAAKALSQNHAGRSKFGSRD
jgi:hypothetical protein